MQRHPVLRFWGPVALWLDFLAPYDSGDTRTGTLAVLAVLIADLTNATLKWPFAGDRPYWVDADRVRQFSITCESGYGHPSGHCMATAAFWCTLYPRLRRVFGAVPTVLCLSIFLVLVGLSRVHVGAHFPSQALAGLICGALLARAAWSMLPRLESRFLQNQHPEQLGLLVSSVVGLLALVGAELWCLGPAVLDRPIHASVGLAHDACHGQVHLSTSPLISVLAIMGQWLGGGLGLRSSLRSSHLGTAHSVVGAMTPAKSLFVCGLGLAVIFAALQVLPSLPPASPPDPAASSFVQAAGVTWELLLLAFCNAAIRGFLVGSWPAAAALMHMGGPNMKSRH